MYLNWMSKLSRPKGVHMTSDEYLRALEILRREYGPYVVGGLSTIEEVLSDVDWEKSPGWPYVNQGCATKREAWEKFEPEIRNRVDKLIRGEYVECLFIASIKDELLPTGKNSRIFLPAPFHHHLACAILFKKAIDSLISSCHKHSSAIGLNIFGRGLERLLRSLSPLPFGYDGDQSGCDTSAKDSEPERDFMKTGLPDEYHSGVDMVWNLAMCPKIIVCDVIIQAEMNPSGWYLTTAFNTLKTHSLVAGAYLDLAPQKECINEMREHLLQANGGDDLAYSTDRDWFDIGSLSHELARRGVYIESDFLEPRDPMTLTFFSHNLSVRQVSGGFILVACGRFAKILSGFSFLKTTKGVIDWQRNASRVVGLMYNLWPFKDDYDRMYPYLYHLVHHYFLCSGSILTPEWDGVFRSMPTEQIMLNLRYGGKRESGFHFFSQLPVCSSLLGVKRTRQSALKDSNTSYNKSKDMSNEIAKNAMLKNENSQLRSELKKLKAEKKERKRLMREKEKEGNFKTLSRNIAANVKNNMSNSKSVQLGGGPGKVSSKPSSALATAMRFLKEVGKETLFTLGAALIAEPMVRAQVGDGNTVPAGTVLKYVDLYPDFADQIQPGSSSRLSTIASTYLRYKFSPRSRVNYIPASGMLANGQIGMFITSDPRFEITTTGSAAVRLVREFGGVITQISQRASLPLPSKQDWLYVESDYADDIRLTRQGTLWVIAATDLVLDPTSMPAIGEFELDYECELKDNSLDGLTLVPINTGKQYVGQYPPTLQQNRGYTSSGAGSFQFYFTDWNTGQLNPSGPPQPAYMFFDTPITTMLDSSSGAIQKKPQYNGDVFAINESGLYRIELQFCCTIGMNAANSGTPLMSFSIYNTGALIDNISSTYPPTPSGFTGGISGDLTSVTYANLASGANLTFTLFMNGFAANIAVSTFTIRSYHVNIQLVSSTAGVVSLQRKQIQSVPPSTGVTPATVQDEKKAERRLSTF